MLCQTSNIFHLSGTPLELDQTYANILTFTQKNAFSKFLGVQNYSHPASKIFSKLKLSEYQLTYFVNMEHPQTGAICKAENTLENPNDLRPFIKHLRTWLAWHHLTPEEVLLAAHLSPLSINLLKGHIPKDPNMKALSVIIKMVDFPGGFGLQRA
jgi:hypothetical protein